jgi:hypothetical protein
LVGIQEVGHKEALGYLVEELNHPTIASVKDYSSRRQGKWTYTISEVAGRMFQVRRSSVVTLGNDAVWSGLGVFGFYLRSIDRHRVQEKLATAISIVFYTITFHRDIFHWAQI